MSARNVVRLTVLALATWSVPLAAQQGKCDVTKNLEVCYGVKLAAAVGDKVEAGTVAKPTGSEATSTGAATGIKDFLPQLASALSIPGFGGDGKGINLAFNLKAHEPVWELPFAIQFKAVSTEPKLFDALRSALPSAVRAAAGDSIAKTLGDLDDVTMSASLNVESRTLGRSYQPHQSEIDGMVRDLLRPTLATVSASDERLQGVVRGTSVDPQATAAECRSADPAFGKPMSCFTAGDRAKLELAIDDVAKAVAAGQKTGAELLTAQLGSLENLLNNQPQFSLSGSYHLRNKLVGVSEVKATARFEYSPVNLNKAGSFCRAAGHTELTVDCLASYLAQPGVKSSLESGFRLWINADLSWSRKYNMMLPGATDSVGRAGSFAFEPALGIGKYLDNSTQKIRFDAEARYRFTNKGDVREKRATVTGTLTQKLSDKSSAIVAVVWANKPEYVGVVDKLIRANLGLSYKLSSDK